MTDDGYSSDSNEKDAQDVRTIPTRVTATTAIYTDMETAPERDPALVRN